MKSNQTYMQKADIEVADLIADGGYLPEERAAQFIRDTIAESVVLKTIQVKGMKSHTAILDKVGFQGRILRPAVSGSALPAADRAKPTTGRVEMQTEFFKGEVRLNDEVLEDNIESGSFKTTVMQLMAEEISHDLDELAVNGDKLSADPFLAKVDGMLKLAVSHLVNAGTVAITKAFLKSAVKAMPSQYKRNKANHVFMTSEMAENDYRDYLADRGTALGDRMITEDVPARYNGRAIMPVPVFPENLGVGANCTEALLLDPKTAVFGFWRRVQLETARDAFSGEWCLISTVRCGFAYQEEDAVVKIQNVRVQ